MNAVDQLAAARERLRQLTEELIELKKWEQPYGERGVARQRWLEAIKRYESELARYELARRGDPVQRSIVGRLRIALERLPVAGRLRWQLLPPGWWRDQRTVAQLEVRARAAGDQLDPARIPWIVRELGDPPAFVGLDEFDGYVAFCPEGARLAVLDNAVVGNAIYILEGDWMGLSQLSKGELLAEHEARVQRIIHKGAWQARLRQALREAGVYHR